jgi:hypothetical protein
LIAIRNQYGTEIPKTQEDWVKSIWLMVDNFSNVTKTPHNGKGESNLPWVREIREEEKGKNADDVIVTITHAYDGSSLATTDRKNLTDIPSIFIPVWWGDRVIRALKSGFVKVELATGTYQCGYNPRQGPIYETVENFPVFVDKFGNRYVHKQLLT